MLHEERRTPLSEFRSEKYDKYTAGLAAVALAVSASACSSEHPGSSDAAPTISEETTVSNDSLQRIEPTVFVLGRDNPYSEQEIRQEIREADKLLRFSTDNELSLRIGDITAVAIEDTSSQTDSVAEPCYSTETVRHIDKQLRASRDLAKNAFTMLILGEKKLCGSAAAIGDLPGRTTIYNVFDSRVALHELGHNLGFSHTKSFDCSIQEEPGDDRRNLKYEHRTIQDQLADGCNVQKSYDGEVDEYSSYDSVMGDLTHSKHWNSQAFLPVELATVIPERFHIEPVKATQGKYPLTMDSGGTVAIEVPLPAEHPLMSIDRDIKSIMFGLVLSKGSAGIDSISDKHAPIDILPIAKGGHGTYVIKPPLLGDLPSYPMVMLGQKVTDKQIFKEYLNHRMQPIIYMDEDLDLVVSIGRDPANDYQPYVQFDTFANTVEKRSYFEAEIAKRSELIFDK